MARIIKLKESDLENIVKLVIEQTEDVQNEEQWIDICLKNIFNQSFKNFEVIIVDNLSNDKTIEKAKKYPVKFLKISKFFMNAILIANDSIAALKCFGCRFDLPFC